MTLNQVLEHFGTKTALADALKINKSAVTNWGESIPESRQYQIQVITKGKLKVDQNKAA